MIFFRGIHRYILVWFVVWTFLINHASAQIRQVDFGLVFPQTEVAVVRITINPDSLAQLLELGQQGSEHEFRATFRFESSNLTQTIQNVGFRLRGNTSLNAAKKSFKISFNTFIEGARWQGLEKINLNGSHNDPTRIRTKLCWDMLREANLPAARTSMVQLYINDQNFGLLTHVEHIDETFTERVFADPYAGNLYKCLYPADLAYISNNPSDYKFELNGRRAYELKTNEYADNYSDLTNFIQILNQTSLDDLPCQLESVFQVDRYLKQAAFDILTGNWDGYIYNKNNYYLYLNRQTGQFEFIHYDLDNTLGIDWVNQDWTQRSVYNWAPSSQDRPLFKRLLQVPTYRNRYTYYLTELMQTVFHADSLRNRINALQELIAPVVAADPFHGLDYGFSFEDFYHGDSLAWGNQVAFGILPYVNNRKLSAVQQLEAQMPVESSISSIRAHHDFPFMNSLHLQILADGAGSVLLEYGTTASEWNSAEVLFDNGEGADSIANDGVFNVQLIPSFNSNRLYYRAKVNGSNSTFPCSGDFVHLTQANTSLLINETMSDNNGLILDEEGQPDDWIELWNAGFSGVNTTGFYLSDNPQNPYKFELPTGFVTPNQFLFFWADNNPLFSRTHCSFSIDNDGEEIRLYRVEDGKPRLCDYVEVPALEPGISYGRENDGASNWIEFSAPTPNQTNQTTGISAAETVAFRMYPNPTNAMVYFSRLMHDVEVSDLSGRMLLHAENTVNINIGHLPEGLYLIRCDKKVFKVLLTPP